MNFIFVSFSCIIAQQFSLQFIDIDYWLLIKLLWWCLGIEYSCHPCAVSFSHTLLAPNELDPSSLERMAVSEHTVPQLSSSLAIAMCHILTKPSTASTHFLARSSPIAQWTSKTIALFLIARTWSRSSHQPCVFVLIFFSQWLYVFLLENCGQSNSILDVRFGFWIVIYLGFVWAAWLDFNLFCWFWYFVWLPRRCYSYLNLRLTDIII